MPPEVSSGMHASTEANGIFMGGPEQITRWSEDPRDSRFDLVVYYSEKFENIVEARNVMYLVHRCSPVPSSACFGCWERR